MPPFVWPWSQGNRKRSSVTQYRTRSGNNWVGLSICAPPQRLFCKRRLIERRSPLVFVPGQTIHRTYKPKGDAAMRFMVIVKASKESEAGVLPSKEILEKMGKFNEELVKAGVMLAGEGL